MSSQKENEDFYTQKIEKTFWFVECGVIFGSMAAFIYGIRQDPNNYHGKIFPSAFLGGLVGFVLSRPLLGEISTNDDQA